MSNQSEAQKVMFTRQLVLNSTPDAIHLVESAIDEISHELDFKDDVYGNVIVAVTEAVNNSIIHGNKSDPDKLVWVEFETLGSYRLTVRVRDEGPGFDPASLSDPTAPENLINIGGRGVFLMQQLSDELSFLDSGRIAQLIFNI